MSFEPAPWSARRSESAPVRPRDYRTDCERDRARIIHSAAFRRLQAKTQVLGIGEDDFHRTRLTHSMEVAQVSGSLVGRVRQLDPDGRRLGAFAPDFHLAEAIGLAHDFGHPPFGHGGEVALNYMMRHHGGFEGNGHTLRLLSIKEPHTEDFGLDLTRRALLGVLKYPVSYSRVVRLKMPPEPVSVETVKAHAWKPPKCYLGSEAEVVGWLLEPLSESDRAAFQECSPPTADEHGKSRHKSFDASLMELADDIAYGVHDVEDGIALRLIQREHWKGLNGVLDDAWRRGAGLPTLEELEEELFCDSSARRKRSIGALVHAFIVSAELALHDQFEHTLLRHAVVLPEPAMRFLKALKSLAVDRMINQTAVQTLEYRGQFVVMSLFQALASDPQRLLPPKSRGQATGAYAEDGEQRAICDYVAGMTDAYAERLYERLFVPGTGSVFARL